MSVVNVNGKLLKIINTMPTNKREAKKILERSAGTL